MDIVYINRKTGKKEKEEVYGGKMLAFLYSHFGLLPRLFLSKPAYFSKIYGYFQKLPWSKRKILPFIKKFKVDTSEFVQPPESFASFNAFFTRKIKPRSLAEGLIIPADGRYLFYQNVQEADGFVIKEKKFCLQTLVQDSKLFEKFKEGSMCIARLCPSDYHRFHFPCDCIPEKTFLINGTLFSVNPIALLTNLNIFTENKRTKCVLKSAFGDILYMEIGATNVGSIHQTYTPGKPAKKGDEKGYFSFGGSTLVLLFEKNRICFDGDLLQASSTHTEILCQMGQSMATYCV